MNKKYQVGIIGYGWAATAHIAAINATRNAEVCAIWSSRPLDSQELSEKYGSKITAYTDLDKMLSSPEVQIVDITSYPNQHAKQFIDAVAAGKHVIVEKPLAIEWSEILAMKRAAEQSRAKVCVCFECRWSSQFQATRGVIDAGLVGSLHYGEVDYYHGIGPWYGQYRWNTKRELGGSALLTAGCHALDALLLCMGSAVEEVTCYSAQSKNPAFVPYEYPTTATTLVRFANGAIGKSAAVVDCLQPYYFHTHLVGSEGSILDNKFHSQKLAGLNKNNWSQLAMQMVDSGDVSDHPYQSQFQAFFDALEADKDMPLTSFADGFATHRVIAAADKSAAEKRPVKVSEIPVA
ncbi:MAG TPA: Gfo/Idh/MocA family oxidoreductase [Chthoniobacter sp.]|jgi:predicted dehydrogenase